jgi:hypothetical protein
MSGGTILRAIGAFIAAAAAIGVIAALMVLPFEPRGAWPAGKIAAEIALVIGLTLGVPVHVILLLAKRTGWRSYLCAGLALGGVVTLLLAWLGFNALPGALSIAGLSLVFGLTGSLTFWLVARPDRTASRYF